MNAVQLFNYEENEVRVIEIGGEPWIVAKDVCDILEHTNPTVALESLDEDERTKVSLGRAGLTNVVSEAGIYRLIFKSRTEKARAFSRWVTHEVLPAIRKTGGYGNQIKQHDPLLERLVRTIADDIVPMLKQQFEQTGKLVERMSEQNRTLEPKPRRKIRQSERDEIYELSNKGFGPAHIGDALDLNVSTVGCIISRARRDGILSRN